jgi:antitoxin component YwqK of YwqJK toxin-antitoxin module
MFLRCLLLAFLFPVLAQAQGSGRRETNRLKNNLREGLWIVYHDSAGTEPMSRGKYHKGLQCGTWKYYDEDGTLRRRERYGKKYIRTRYYHENGTIKSCGKAVLDRSDPVYLNYFYQGKWKYYNASGKLTSVTWYEHGQQVREEKRNDE